uniref:Uncharacterized protein n=1 Tax=Arundo donax TaxID=35708 RepID=A0A0A9BIA4_ARUDO
MPSRHKVLLRGLN